MSQLRLEITADGSHTLVLPDEQEQYHSIHGAIQESEHVFMQAGLMHYLSAFSGKSVQLLEIGMGTGLNVLLTYLLAKSKQVQIRYTSLEAFPLQQAIYSQLNYADLLAPKDEEVNDLFQQIHCGEWGKEVSFCEHFQFIKLNTRLEEFQSADTYQLIFFDAFSPRVQPELWTTEIFAKLYTCMSQNSILVTYCAKGEVKRNLKSAGFSLENIPGPPGKREMIRATKIN